MRTVHKDAVIVFVAANVAMARLEIMGVIPQSAAKQFIDGFQQVTEDLAAGKSLEAGISMSNQVVLDGAQEALGKVFECAEQAGKGEQNGN